MRGDVPRALDIDPIITMNAGGVIQSASESVQSVFGWTPAELFGRNVKVLIPEPRRSALDRYLDRYRNSDGIKALQRTGIFDAVRKDGSPVQIELSMSRADLPAQSAPYFIGIIRDVGKEIDIGVDSASVRARLQYLVTEQTRALATANLRLQLSDRLASLGTLAAGLGHDMNNILLPIRARLNALEHAGISSAALGHVSAVRQSIAYLQHLSEGLHFLSANPEGEGPGTSAEGTTDLAVWWAQVGDLLRKVLPRKVRVETSIARDLPHVQIAPHWLTQAMLNLLVNAAESIAGGRARARVRVWARASDDGATVLLGVTDTGRGMSIEIQRRAFDLFFTTKARGMGTGLGLPLVRKVALRAGGDAQISSVPGKGTTVTLMLPVASVREFRPAPGGPGNRAASVTIRNVRSRGLVSQILLGAGYRVVEGTGAGPGRSSIWVTTPTPAAYTKAARWRKGRGERAIVLLGAPAARDRDKWAGLGASVIEPPGDFMGMRLAIGEAILRVHGTGAEERAT